MMIETIGILAGALTLIGYLPQAIKTIRTRHTKDISLLGFLLIFMSALLWAIYGLAKIAPEIWVANGIVMLCSGAVAVIKIHNIVKGEEKNGLNRQNQR